MSNVVKSERADEYRSAAVFSLSDIEARAAAIIKAAKDQISPNADNTACLGHTFIIYYVISVNGIASIYKDADSPMEAFLDSQIYQIYILRRLVISRWLESPV